ncbi:hypothetical protein QNN03_05175 [Streptomyces sp. GXMU-J15]|uniref:Secreted protein n=1 Tax=Streptomyces fuscus TaxID=3048495 RepID=A0ABT7IUR0_9ACTN|nr:MULTISPECIES: hypothetical protein [Streptomyces]MDL2075824.1 hypothetical protein [Streptomyces fuscus]SBT92788.1 hypothetical protein GA0115233_10519 [Streptomyces sp. DI166]
MIKVKRTAVIVLAVAAFAASAPAFAFDASTDGAYAWTSSDDHYANIKDTAKDGHPVKAQYYRWNDPDLLRTLWEKRGYGYSNASGYGSWVLKIKACEYINNWPDECSAWDDD